MKAILNKSIVIDSTTDLLGGLGKKD